ncbi:MAG: hypothetical protein KGL01_07475 [Betaproteobacteria bacterium]|nr:hypothetical protein [Betaproteobacteria bacterium]
MRNGEIEFTGTDIMDKTVKLRAYSEPAKSAAPEGDIKESKDQSLELAAKEAQLAEEKSKSLENLKTIVQLRENLKQEQAKTAELARKTAELEAKANESSAPLANELAKKSAQLEEEKKRSLEQLKTIEQLRESLKQEQARSAAAADKAAGLEAKVKDLNNVLGKISSIAEAGKMVGNT